MSTPSNTRIVFFQVRDNAAKLQRIVETAQTHFDKREPLLIFVENAQSQAYVDDLLWKLPAASFLPHTPADDPTTDLLAITKSKSNLNQARIAFNLCATPLLLPFRLIYDLEDLTTSAKKNLSSLRLDAYKAASYLIEAR